MMWVKMMKTLRGTFCPPVKLSENVADHVSSDVGQPEIATVETIGQFFVTQTEHMQ